MNMSASTSVMATYLSVFHETASVRKDADTLSAIVIVKGGIDGDSINNSSFLLEGGETKCCLQPTGSTRQQHEDETLKDDASTDLLEGALPVYDEHQTLPVLMHFDGICEGGDAFSSSCVAPSTTKIVFAPSATNMASLHNKATPTPPPQLLTTTTTMRGRLLSVSCIAVKSTQSGPCCYNHDAPPSTPPLITSCSFSSGRGRGDPRLHQRIPNPSLHAWPEEEEPVRLFEPGQACLVGTLRRIHDDIDNQYSNTLHRESNHQHALGREVIGQHTTPKKPSSTASSPRNQYQRIHGIPPHPSQPKLLIALGLSGVLVYANKGSKIRKLKALPNRPPDAHLQITSNNRPSVVPETISVYYRPHIAQFFTSVLKHFDIAIFSTGEQDYVDALLDVMDPTGQVFPKSRRYYRQHCTKVVCSTENGQRSSLAKNLQILGRPFNEVVLVDDTTHSGLLQPNNLLLLPTWTGDPTDTALLQLTNALSHIAKCRQ